MIKSITVTNHLGNSKKFDLTHPEKSGYIIQKIEGLVPCKANINISEMAIGDGGFFNSSRLSSRNIILSVKILPNPKIEDKRQELYSWFSIKQSVKLLIETDNRICYTQGYVESNEPDIFSMCETSKISIICPDPYFYSAGPDGIQSTVFSGINPQFEFPFSNESTTAKIIIFGSIEHKKEQTVYYSGDANVGIVITIHAIGTANDIHIYNLKTKAAMHIDAKKIEQLTGSGIIAGDEIIISTVKREKYIRLLRNGTYINILNCLGKDSQWFELSRGDNIFVYSADDGSDINLQLSIKHKTVYEGI